MKPNNLLRALSLLVLLVSLFPINGVEALAIKAVPPIDMFQLPWDQGIAWVAIDGIDNGTKRPLSSSHNYSVGGAIDFAPRSKMVTGEDTSTFWVAAAAAGTVIEISSCAPRRSRCCTTSRRTRADWCQSKSCIRQCGPTSSCPMIRSCNAFGSCATSSATRSTV